jgi:hypothetical protein
MVEPLNLAARGEHSMSRRTWNRQAVALIAMICIASPAISADHRDGPRVVNTAATLGALDLNDLYVFASPTQRQNTVLILTTGGLDVGIISPPFFLPGAVYEIRVSNDGVKTDDELVFQFVFSGPDRFGRQNYTVRLIRRKRTTWNNPIIARGFTGQRVAGQLGTTIQAGIFDDPFFFDSAAFAKFRTAVQQGKTLSERVAPFLPPNTPINGFRKNTLAIVMELPRGQLQSSPSNPNITVWLRALRPDKTQFDRTGLPAINTATLFDFGGRPNLQDAFNDLTPAQDLALIPEAAQRINLIYGLPLTGAAPNGGPNATQLAAVVLPDVMPFNTTSTSGFLNGRRLTDDVIDAELELLTGGALTSDRVGNDSVFLDRFPYLGAPIPPP